MDVRFTTNSTGSCPDKSKIWGSDNPQTKIPNDFHCQAKDTRINHRFASEPLPGGIGRGHGEVLKILSNSIFKNTFSASEKELICLLYVKLISNKSVSNGTKDFIRLCNSLKKSLGATGFHLMMKSSSYPNDINLSKWVTLVQHAIDLSNEMNKIRSSLRAFYKGTMSYQGLIEKFLSIKLAIHQNRFSKKSLEDVVKAYKNCEHPLKSNEIDALKKNCVEVFKFREKYKDTSVDDLSAFILKLKKANTSSLSVSLELLALISEVLKRMYGISPYNTQIMAVLALMNHPSRLKGAIAQIATGEGKSTIVALFSGWLACKGRDIDIISSSRYLAQRDHKKYSPFYAKLGVSTSHICSDSITSDNFSGQIVYGTHYDFEFSIMREHISQDTSRIRSVDGEKKSRACDVVIVDEVDNLFVDSAMSSARIAISHFRETNWVYHPLLEVVKANKNEVQKLIGLSVNDFKSMWRLLENNLGGHYLQKIKNISNKQILTWITSAYTALFQMKEGEDYVVKSPESGSGSGSSDRAKIVIVDHRNTGRLKINSRWSNGVHEFLEAKHNLNIEKESLTPASMSHSVFFNFYKNIYGVTGTVGGQIERSEIQSIYGLSSFDVPAHRPNKRIIKPPVFAKNENALLANLLNIISDTQASGRPLLILTDTISRTKVFSDYLAKNHVNHSILNEDQSETEGFIILQAGKPQAVTIATNAAGRGTDIALSGESLKNGGLHVVLTSYSENQRVQRQAEGRSARQGQLGSSQLLLDLSRFSGKFLNGQHLEALLLKTEDKNKIKILEEYRNAQSESASQSRMLHSKISEIDHSYLQAFLDSLKNWYSALDDSFLREFDSSSLGIHSLKPNYFDGVDLGNILEECGSSSDVTAGLLLAKGLKGRLFLHIQQVWAFHFYQELDALQEGSSSADQNELIRDYSIKIKKHFVTTSLAWQKHFDNPKESFRQLIYMLRTKE